MLFNDNLKNKAIFFSMQIKYKQDLILLRKNKGQLTMPMAFIDT